MDLIAQAVVKDEEIIKGIKRREHKDTRTCTGRINDEEEKKIIRRYYFFIDLSVSLYCLQPTLKKYHDYKIILLLNITCT